MTRNINYIYTQSNTNETAKGAAVRMMTHKHHTAVTW